MLNSNILNISMIELYYNDYKNRFKSLFYG